MIGVAITLKILVFVQVAQVVIGIHTFWLELLPTCQVWLLLIIPSKFSDKMEWRRGPTSGMTSSPFFHNVCMKTLQKTVRGLCCFFFSWCKVKEDPAHSFSFPPHPICRCFGRNGSCFTLHGPPAEGGTSCLTLAFTFRELVVSRGCRSFSKRSPCVQRNHPASTQIVKYLHWRKAAAEISVLVYMAKNLWFLMSKEVWLKCSASSCLVWRRVADSRGMSLYQHLLKFLTVESYPISLKWQYIGILD